MRTRWFVSAVLVLVAVPVSGQVLPPEQQITAALLAAPAELRDGARVLGWADAGVTELRAGSNDLVCLSDDPRDETFEVTCYHESLEPYMARGRELRAQGVENTLAPRWEEIASGTLPMPTAPTTQYVLGGHPGATFDPATGTAPGAVLRWNVHIPGATAESTGLSTEYSPYAPWIMYPGTPGAHIMIVPPMPRG